VLLKEYVSLKGGLGMSIIVGKIARRNLKYLEFLSHSGAMQYLRCSHWLSLPMGA
jgi:hypothetical protein